LGKKNSLKKDFLEKTKYNDLVYRISSIKFIFVLSKNDLKLDLLFYLFWCILTEYGQFFKLYDKKMLCAPQKWSEHAIYT